MPGRSGKQVLEALRELRPALPVVVVSGCCAEQIESQDARTIFLEKPVPVARLRMTLCQLLSDPHHAHDHE